jgi:hypothetical protein
MTECWDQIGPRKKSLEILNQAMVLKEMSEESGIPWKTLYDWWRQYEILKNQNNGQPKEKNGKNNKSCDHSDHPRP